MSKRTRAKPNTPERYLWAKPGARHLWFRLAVPTRFQAIEPRRIIQRSLGTSDRRHASVAAGELRAELHRAWEDRLNPSASVKAPGCDTPAERLSPTEADLVAAAAEAAFTKVLPKLNALLDSKAPETNDGYKALLENLEDRGAKFMTTEDGDKAVWSPGRSRAGWGPISPRPYPQDYEE